MTWRGWLLAALIALPAMAPPSAQAQFTTEAEEAAQGAQAHKGLVTQFGGVYDDPDVGLYVAQVGARLLAAAGQQGKEYRFTVLDSDLPNAFALPGGFAYITRGMLALINTEAELASVMGHEIGHVIARHSAERQSGAMITGLLAGAVGVLTGNNSAAQIAGLLGQGALASYSRGQEYEADQLGILYMVAGGWNPLAAGDMLSGLKRSSDVLEARFGQQDAGWNEFFATHPNTLERIGRAVALARDTGANGDYGRDRWMRVSDGLMYLGSPASGYVRGRDFLHPQLAIAFTVPPGWVLANQATQVSAQGKDGAMAFDMARQQNRASDPLYYLTQEWLKGRQSIQPARASFAGLPAAVTTVRVPTQGGGEQLVQLAVIERAPKQFYRFQFVMRDSRQTQPVVDTLRSFRRLGPDELRDLHPWRIRVFRVNPGDTIASLSAMMVVPQDKEQTFRLLNALDAGMELRPGDLVKIVRDGPLRR
ncbi:MAG: M48 family metalloprotease [Alphaproteobacteria bacterium]